MRTALAVVLWSLGCSGASSPPPARDASAARATPHAQDDGHAASDSRPEAFPLGTGGNAPADPERCVDGVAPAWTAPPSLAADAHAVAACADAFRRSGDRIARTPARRWTAPALRALASCALLPATLRDGATEAARARDPAARAAVLAEAAASLLPERCRPAEPTAASSTIGGCCPAPGDLPSVDAAPPVDAGTWVFTVAIWRALESAGAADRHARRLIDELCQSVGLERMNASPR